MLEYLSIAVVLSLAVGFFAGWYATQAGYAAKLKAIADTVKNAETHYSQEVRTFAARVKALL